jgi:hypothetical protein
MLQSSPRVRQVRQCLPDAQAALAGAVMQLGYFTVRWHWMDVSDELGSFAVVDGNSPISGMVGDTAWVSSGARGVAAYVIGSQHNLGADISIERRAFMQIGLLAESPMSARVGVVRA